MLRFTESYISLNRVIVNMELNFKNQILNFSKESKYNLIANTEIGKYNQIEINVNINNFTNVIDHNMVLNILEYADKELDYLEQEFKPLLAQLLMKQYSHFNESIEIKKIEFVFSGIWIKSMHVFNSQFELVYYLDGKTQYPNLDVTGNWTVNFSGSINNWIISGVNRIG